MDYSGIANLALVTVFSSTILAPNLKKIGEIKDEVSAVDFPVVNREGHNDDRDKEQAIKGIELTKKLTQYKDKYTETQRFLNYFYFILAVISSVQLVLMIAQDSLWTSSGALFFGSVVVVFIVIAIIRSYMTKPSTVRSLQWLAAKGIAGVHTNTLFNPEFALNAGASNIMKDGNKLSFGIRSKANIDGYGYIFTIESQNYKKLYGLCVGFIGEYSLKNNMTFPNGETGSEVHLAKVELNPGNYITRLIFLTAVYDGNYEPSETIIEFTVSKKGKVLTTPQLKAIQMESNSSGYVFTVKHKGGRHKLIHAESDETFIGDDNMSFILISKSLLKYLRKGYRPIAFFSKKGDIDRYDLDKYLSWHRVARKRIRVRFRNFFKKPRGHLILLKRNPKSRLNIS